MKMKKLVVVFVLLLAIGGGALGVMKFLGGEEDPLLEAQGDVGFLHLKPLFAPIVRHREFQGYVVLSLELELADRENLSYVEHRMQGLRDAFIEDLHLQAVGRRTDAPNIDLRELKKRFLALSEEVLGPGIVTDVLVQSVMERRS
jgi:flagellar basal body-associated protein FliL